MPVSSTCGRIFSLLAIGALLAVSALLAPGAHAQSVESFYRGNTVNLIMGYPPAGANDRYGRLVARHIGKHIPGNPTVVAKNMPGGGSLIASNHLYNVAPKDGTVLGLVVATMVLESRLGAKNVKFNASDFRWIGRMAPAPNVTFVLSSSPVKTIKDAMERETVLAATGRASTVAIYPSVLNNVVGTKFKLVMGYQGSAACMLAMERGEVEGHSTSWEGLRSARGDWVRDKKITILVQHGLKRHPQLPDVPTAVELGRTPDEKQILRTVVSASDIGRFILTTPGVPADRLQALRRAFDATMKDPEFIADVKTARVELSPLPGEEMQKLVDEVRNVSPAIIEKVKAVYPTK